MSRGPDFDELVEGLPADERERLRRVHDVLLAVGPPPELPPGLEEAPGLPRHRERAPMLTTLPRRRLAAIATGALGIAAGAFGLGYLLGADDDAGVRREAVAIFTLPMKATEVQPRAVGVLRVGKKEEGGNIPLVLTVSGLRDLGRDGHYELWLTRKGKRVVSCGSFVATDRDFVVRLNAPYTLEEFAGWVIVEDLDRRERDPVVLTTEA
ncbi:MAG: anti-sigma factor [Thermoleophilia bacterium]|nr:anti-sigma factor [Thermoleophilia bacterium]